MKPHSKARISDSTLDRVMDMIRSGYYAPSKIAVCTSLPARTVQHALDRLKQDGRIGDDHRPITRTLLEQVWR